MRPPSFQAQARAGLLAVAILLLAGNLRAALTSVGPLVGEIRGDTGARPRRDGPGPHWGTARPGRDGA